MTGDLNLMMKLRNQQIVKDANIKAAESIGKMAELGYFDTEFTMYGCAYLSPVDEKMYYKVSSLAEDIYDFIEKSSRLNIYPSNVMQLSRKCSVPSGMKDMIAQDVKWELAKKLNETNLKNFFEILYQLAQDCTIDVAADILWKETERLEGVFEEEKLNQFEELLHYVYNTRNITTSSYTALLEWLRNERKNMDNDFISKDIFEKTLYGLAYEQDGKVKYIENAQKGYIYEKLYYLEQQGIFTAPVYAKTYWYNYEYRLQDVKRDFKQDLRNARDKAYLNQTKILCENPKPVSKEQFQNLLMEINEKWGAFYSDTIVRYGHRWGVCK